MARAESREDSEIQPRPDLRNTLYISLLIGSKSRLQVSKKFKYYFQIGLLSQKLAITLKTMHVCKIAK